jgi:starch-binding outer membrane protein, SusD/RagB family
MMNVRRYVASSVLLGALTGIVACGDLLNVSNPGAYDDQDLNLPSALAPLVVGMSFDLSRAMDQVLQNSSIMGDDLYHGGSYGPQGLFNRGVIAKEDVNGMWGEMHRARWVAEQGIIRIKTVLGAGYDSSALAARANIYAGFSNRLLGEHVCDAVIDGGSRQDFSIHFQRADSQFTEALRILTNVTPVALRDSLRRAAYGGRTSVRAWQNKWTEAVADAANLPTSYVFVAFFSTNTPAENNDLVFETNNRLEYTVFNTQWAQVFRDGRVPWDTVKTTGGAVQVGQDGRTPFFRQRKYNGLGADVPLTKGTEMLLLRAEAALRTGDSVAAMGFINQSRAFYSTTANPLPPLAVTSVAATWPILQKERAATLWMEGRRFWDLRRWNTEQPPIKNTFLDTRDKCIPISEEEEQSNPNV